MVSVDGREFMPIVRASTKKWLMDLGFFEGLAHYLAAGTSPSTLLLLRKDEPIWKKGVTPQQLFKWTQEYELGRHGYSYDPIKFESGLRVAIQNLNNLKKTIEGWEELDVLWSPILENTSKLIHSLNNPLGIEESQPVFPYTNEWGERFCSPECDRSTGRHNTCYLFT
jgi:hypothetical protein